MNKRSRKPTRSGSRSASGRRRKPPWVRLPDEELLGWRICDLKLRIEGTLVAQRVARLYAELEFRGLSFRPHCWLSDEWFSPDGIPGIAIPFYLAHPRLIQLEKRQLLEVEGGSREWCMRILRHETGHAVDTAYRLYRRRSWQKIFGLASAPYPDHYSPKPTSKKYVVHLEQWYAQSHPSEDFAETFAVWLKPRSRWRIEYADWPALRKLDYVNRTMRELRSLKPLVRSHEHIDSVNTLKKTLREHYEERRSRYLIGNSKRHDEDLLRLFSVGPQYASRPSAARFLWQNRQVLSQIVARWTGQYQYTVDHVLRQMIARCRELRLRLTRSSSQTLREAQVMLAVQTMNLRAARHKVAL
jgi:hypothetical protein